MLESTLGEIAIELQRITSCDIIGRDWEKAKFENAFSWAGGLLLE